MNKLIVLITLILCATPLVYGDYCSIDARDGKYTVLQGDSTVAVFGNLEGAMALRDQLTNNKVCTLSYSGGCTISAKSEVYTVMLEDHAVASFSVPQNAINLYDQLFNGLVCSILSVGPVCSIEAKSGKYTVLQGDSTVAVFGNLNGAVELRKLLLTRRGVCISPYSGNLSYCKIQGKNGTFTVFQGGNEVAAFSDLTAAISLRDQMISAEVCR